MIEKLVDTCSVAAGGLLKRSVQTAEVSTAKASSVAPSTNQVMSQGLQHLTSIHLGLLGPEASAGAVARAITASLKTVDVESKMKTVALHSLPVYWRAQPALHPLMEADDKAAKDSSPQRSAFTYVDLTHKDLLPLSMSSEAVGGRTPRPGELEWDLNADTTSLGASGRAFKSALEKPRYFRSMVHWSAVWNRYAPAAVAMGQRTWPLALNHLGQMYKLVEEEHCCGNNPAVVFVYDELL